MRRPAPCLLAMSLLSMACHESENPAGPSAVGAAPAPPALSANAIPIALGQAVSGAVKLTDPPCDSGLGTQEPCQRFVVSASTTGVLRVQVTSPGPSTLTLRVGASTTWGVTSLVRAVRMQPGWTYEISVQLHDAVLGSTSQAFELITWLDPA